MPTLIIDGVGIFDVEKGTKLLNALVEHGGDPRYSCGGKAKCRDCRVEFIDGEPKKMTKAERSKLKNKGALGKYRLSCQCLVKKDMHVKVLKQYATLKKKEKRPELSKKIKPKPVWVKKKKKKKKKKK